MASNRSPQNIIWFVMGCQFPQPDVYFVALMKNLNNILFFCPVNKIIWRKLWSWLRSPPLYNPSFMEIFNENSGFIKNKLVVKLFHTVRTSFIWHVWDCRNKILHASSDTNVNAIHHEDIFSFSAKIVSFMSL